MFRNFIETHELNRALRTTAKIISGKNRNL